MDIGILSLGKISCLTLPNFPVHGRPMLVLAGVGVESMPRTGPG